MGEEEAPASVLITESVEGDSLLSRGSGGGSGGGIRCAAVVVVDLAVGDRDVGMDAVVVVGFEFGVVETPLDAEVGVAELGRWARGGTGGGTSDADPDISALAAAAAAAAFAASSDAI